MVSKKIEIIKRRLQASIDQQKKSTKNCRRPLEFEVKDNVFLKISSIQGVMRFGEKGKLSPWYVEPFEVIK